MDYRKQVLAILDNVLNLDGRSAKFNDDSPLLGSLPELDSIGVAGILTAFEERLGITIDDDEIDGTAFATVGSLVRFVEQKVAA